MTDYSDTPFKLATTYGRLTQSVGGDSWTSFGPTVSKLKQQSERRNHEKSQRMRSGRANRQDVAMLVASYERMTPRPPVSLPRISIQQQDAE